MADFRRFAADYFSLMPDAAADFRCRLFAAMLSFSLSLFAMPPLFR